MGRTPSLDRLLRELLALLQDTRQLEKLVTAHKQSPRLREKFELQMWALYGMLHWDPDNQGRRHPGWTEGLLRVAKQREQSGEALHDSVLSFLRAPRRHGSADE